MKNGRMDVAVVGGGMAGMTAALRLVERGYHVTLYEVKKSTLGGNVSSENLFGIYHDTYPHMFCDWYDNFWDIFENDLGLERRAYFEPRTSVKLLRKGGKVLPTGRLDYLTLWNASTPRNVWRNLRSGVLPFPDMFLTGFSMLDLAAQPFDQSELLAGLSVNGFLYSRPYASEQCAELHDLILMEIWSIHGDLTSAASYKDFLRYAFNARRSVPFAWVLKGCIQQKLIGPWRRKLEALGCDIQMGCELEKVRIGDDAKVTLEFSKKEEESTTSRRFQATPDCVVLAVPPKKLAELVIHGDPGTRIVDRVPGMSEVRRLHAVQIAVVDLYFKRKLPDIPKDHVGLSWSASDLTFLDLSQLWTDDPNMRDRTALVLAASDFFALPEKAEGSRSEEDQRDGWQMIQQLHDYLPVFDPGKFWGDPESDICWEKTQFIANHSNKLFINEVGNWGWQPEACYESLPNVFFAGNYCRTGVAMATIESAVVSGLKAAQAVWRKRPMGEPVMIAEPEMYSDAAFLAVKLAWLPAAYWAKWWSIAFEASAHLSSGDLAKGLVQPAARMMLLPVKYTADWWETAATFWKSALFDDGSFVADGWSRAWDAATTLWSRLAFAARPDDVAALRDGPYRRRWRVKE